MADISQVKLPDGTTYNLKDNSKVAKAGDTMTGNLTAPKFIGALQGNADTATYATSAGSAASMYETNLKWGNTNTAGGVSPIGMSLSAEHSANKLAYFNGDLVTSEFSSDGGATWTAHNLDKNAKSWFCTYFSNINVGRQVGSNDACTLDSKTRITITAQDGTDPSGRIYTNPKKLLINVSTANGLEVLVEYRTGTNYLNNGAWTTFGTYPVSGWSGWNDIPLVLGTLGGGSSQTSNNWQLRLTFSVTSLHSSTTSRKQCVISGIRLFGENAWYVGNNMAQLNHLYAYDVEQGAVFPGHIYPNVDNSKSLGLSSKKWANVWATNFNGNLQGNANTATTASNLTNFQVSLTGSLGLDISTNSIGYVGGLTRADWNYQMTDGAIYGQTYSAAWKHEIFGDYRTGHMSVRGKNNGTWQPWNLVLDSGNVGYVYSSTITYNPHERKFITSKSTSAWDTQVYSKQGYIDNVYVSFRPTQTNMAMMIGLDSNPSESTGYDKIDYCWYTQNSGSLSIYENNTSIASITGHTTYAAGDELRVEYSGGYVRYYHNGVLCRSVARAIGEKLYMDSSLHGASSTFYDVYFGNSITKASAATTADTATSATTASKLGSSNVGSATNPIYLSSGTATACTYSLNKTVPSDAVFTDTKNTAGSTDTSSKIFLIGATSQAANPQTYSQDTAYVGTDGCLYSGGTKVLTSHQDISGKADKSATVSTVTYDTTNKKITKTINGTTTDVVTASTLKTDMALNNVGNFKAVSTVASQGLTSTEQSNARANIGAGTSSLTIGTTATTAMAGNTAVNNVTQELSTSNVNYQILCSSSSSNTTGKTYKCDEITINPSKSELVVSGAKGSVSLNMSTGRSGFYDAPTGGNGNYIAIDPYNENRSYPSLQLGNINNTASISTEISNGYINLEGEPNNSNYYGTVTLNTSNGMGSVWVGEYPTGTGDEYSLDIGSRNITLYGTTWDGTNTSLKSAITGKVSKSGDTMTGALKVQNADLSRICTGVTLGKTANNGVTSNQYPLIKIQDSAEVYVGALRTTCWTSGDVGVDIVARNVTTSGDGTPFENHIRILAKKDGSKTYEVSDPANFRRAIGLGKTYSFTSSAAQNISNNTETAAGSLTITEAGTYIFIACAAWASNSSGYREIRIANNSSTAALDRFALAITPPSSGVNTIMQVITTVAVSANSVYRVVVKQNSGTTLSLVNCGLKVVRIG